MKNLLFYYCLVLTALLTLGAASSSQTGSILPLILILPVIIYFLSLLLVRITNHHFSFPFQKPLNTLNLYYSFIVVTIMTVSGLIGAKNIPQLISGIVFLPLAGYFILQVFPKRKLAIHIPTIVLQPKELKQFKKSQVKHDEKLVNLPKIDIDRRQFLKFIGSAGISLFLFSIFAQKAEAAFFGSVPGPGTVALKDTTGVPIDPAQKQPTDGYKISEVDDSSPAYYGFVDKDGKWFIMKESSGAYRYVKGDSAFTDAWGIRVTRDQDDYKYFNVIFS